ncbi:uncharacterized protein LOC142565923 [Dermacentor variabilis]|uniref:uncharacterized protein LOC142565923 n=1 Tax=Dermacentor variabilis TaxID=34621 RepID=UPI003F5C0066
MVSSVIPSVGMVPLEVRRIDNATQQPTTRDERRQEGRASHTASAALCFSVVTLVFVAGMALLASGLHWWGLCLVGAALLLLVSLCLLPGGRGQRPLDHHGSLQGRRVAFAGEPVPVSTCAHLRTISGNVVPYLLEEMTLADVSRMYPPPFPPPPYQAKATDARKQ